VAVPGFHFFYLHAGNQTGDATSGSVKWTGDRCIRAHIMLVNVNHSGQQNGFAADCFIESYNDKQGVTHSGLHDRLVTSKPGDATDHFKEVHFRLNVNGCVADALAIVEYFS
jgi:hypothetical protein